MLSAVRQPPSATATFSFPALPSASSEVAWSHPAQHVNNISNINSTTAPHIIHIFILIPANFNSFSAIPSVLWHCCYGDSSRSQPVKKSHTSIPKVNFLWKAFGVIFGKRWVKKKPQGAMAAPAATVCIYVCSWVLSRQRYGMMNSWSLRSAVDIEFHVDLSCHSVPRAGLRGCKNRPTPFRGQISYKATKPGSVLFLSLDFWMCLLCLFALCYSVCSVAWLFSLGCLYQCKWNLDSSLKWTIMRWWDIKPYSLTHSPLSFYLSSFNITTSPSPSPPPLPIPLSLPLGFCPTGLFPDTPVMGNQLIRK